jgi:hypothetical protein
MASVPTEATSVRLEADSRRTAMSSARRTFAVTVITEVDFVDDNPSTYEQNVLEHLSEDLRRVADGLSLRSIQGVRVLYCGGGVLAAPQ